MLNKVNKPYLAAAVLSALLLTFASESALAQRTLTNSNSGRAASPPPAPAPTKPQGSKEQVGKSQSSQQTTQRTGR